MILQTKSSIPTLIKDKIEYKTGKVGIFASLLGDIYADNKKDPEFYKLHKIKVNKVVEKDFISFSISKLFKVINKLKVNSSPWSGQMQNIFLKNLPYDFLSKVL